MSGLRYRIGAVGAFLAIFVYLALANLASEQTRIESPLLPDEGLRLGLDLQGGIHWVLGVKLSAGIEHELEFLAGSLTEDAERSDYSVGDVDVEAEQLRITVVGETNAASVRDWAKRTNWPVKPVACLPTHGTSVFQNTSSGNGWTWSCSIF